MSYKYKMVTETNQYIKSAYLFVCKKKKQIQFEFYKLGVS